MNDSLKKLAKEVESDLKPIFNYIDDIAFINQERVMKAFSANKVSSVCFDSTSGYGYDDLGRETLEKIYSDVFESEAAIVRHSIVSGTHALSIALFGLLRPHDKLLCISGKPYDTLETVISGEGCGSLKDFLIDYKYVDLKENNEFDLDSILKELDNKVKIIYIQKSRGYSSRETIKNSKIGEIISLLKDKCNAYFVVDNCYGEFCEEHEPCYYGADLVVGSLIKNPGGGMAESGAYLAGKNKCIELCAQRMTCPGIGGECGATLNQNKQLFKGIFYAPHTTAQALKTAVFASALFEKLDFTVSPKSTDVRYDIIQTLYLNTAETIEKFCQGLQAGSPVDSHFAPIFAPMPGYACDIIMAAGTFTQGASVELSADAPKKPPFIVYMQGGLTYESGKYGVLKAAEAMLK